MSTHLNVIPPHLSCPSIPTSAFYSHSQFRENLLVFRSFMPFPLHSTPSKQRNRYEHDNDMVPVSYPHNFGFRRQQSHPAIGSSVYKQDPQNFSFTRRYQEEQELEPMEKIPTKNLQLGFVFMPNSTPLTWSTSTTLRWRRRRWRATKLSQWNQTKWS